MRWTSPWRVCATKTTSTRRRLRYLLSIPVEGVTVPMLRMDPRWASIRDDPGFQALVGADQD